MAWELCFSPGAQRRGWARKAVLALVNKDSPHQFTWAEVGSWKHRRWGPKVTPDMEEARDRGIVHLRVRGWTVEEVAELFQCDVKTVQDACIKALG